MRLGKKVRRGIGCAFGVGLLIVAGIVVQASLPRPVATSFETAWLRSGVPQFRDFLADRRLDGKTIVLGTSETDECFDGENYWGFLEKNGVPNIVFAGAGRGAVIWTLLLHLYGEAFRDVNVVFYSNPIYWKGDLNRPRFTYLRRYLSWYAIGKALGNMTPEGRDAVLPKRPPPFLAAGLGFPVVLDDFLGAWFGFDLRPRLQLAAPTTTSCPLPAGTEPKDLPDYDFAMGAEKKRLDGPGGKVEEVRSGYQTDVLRELVRAGKKYGVKLTVVVGPFNATLARARTPDTVAQYEALHGDIVAMLQQEQARIVDAFEYSYGNGNFLDSMHLSPKGGFHVAQSLLRALRSL